MEGAPLFPVEDEKTKRFEALDVDDDSKDKKKKKKRSDASAIHSRIDTEKPQELQEKRQNARKELGELSLGGLFDKQENEKKPFDSESAFTVAAQVIDAEKISNDQSEFQAEEQRIEYDAVEVDLPAEDHPELYTEARVDTPAEILSEDSGELPTEESSSEQTEPDVEEFSGSHVEDSIEENDELADQVAPVVASSTSTLSGHQQSGAQQPYRSRLITPPAPPVPQSSGGGGSSNTPPTPPIPPVPPSVGGQSNPNFGGIPNANNYNQPPTPPYTGGNPNIMLPGQPNNNPNTTPRQPSTLEQRPIVIEKHNHFLAGLIVGGLYEHFKHRKREKQLKKENEQIKQDVIDLHSQQFKNEEQLKKVKTELASNQQSFEQVSKIGSETVRPVEGSAASIQEQKAVSTPSRVGEIVTDTIKAAAELAAVPLVVATEKNRPFEVPRSAEFGPALNIAEKQQSKPEVLPQAAEAQDEPLEVAEGAHVEMSSWHRIEVDNKTGRAVENPATAYGHEFEVEHRQETRGGDTDAGLQSAAQAVHFGSGQTQSTQASSMPADTQLGAQNASSKARNPTEETQKISQDSSGPIVGLSIALVVAIGLLIFVLL